MEDSTSENLDMDWNPIRQTDVDPDLDQGYSNQDGKCDVSRRPLETSLKGGRRTRSVSLW